MCIFVIENITRMMKQLWGICLVLFSQLHAQTNCKVIVYDQLTHKPIQKTTVTMVHERSGKLLGYNHTNGFGRVNIALNSVDSVKVILHHSKYVPYFLKGYRCKDTLFLYPQSKVIKEVLIQGKRAVTMNGDTVSYIADSFKVPAGSSVEDLLKRLPGLQVSKDGSIKAQGKKVERVLVDGDDFFGNDATVATRNLEASMIDKVEVIDVESQRAQTTGESDADKTKIINLKLKEDAKKGFFGKTKQAYTNTNRYESTNMVNLFRGKLKAGVYGIADNMEARMDWQDRQDLGLGSGNWYYDEELDDWVEQGGDMSLGNTAGVIPQNIKSGLIFSKQFDDGKGRISANYRYNQSQHRGSQYANNSLIYEGGKRNTATENKINTTTTKNNVQFYVERQVDSLNKFRFKTNVNILSNNGENQMIQNIMKDSTLVNSSIRENPTNAQKANYDIQGEWEHKFKKKGRFFGLASNLIFTNLTSEGLNMLNGYTYDSLGNSKTQRLDQFRANYDRSTSIKISSTYIEPLIKDKLYLDVAASALLNLHQSYNNTYNNTGQNGYTDLVAGLSNNYKYNANAYSQGLNIRYKSKKIETNLGLKVQETSMNQIALDSGRVGIQRDFYYLLPNYKFTWKYKRNSSFNLGFSTGVTPPQLSQIQPFIDNENPQYITEGNPSLKPSYSYRFNVSNSFWYPVSQTNLWTSFNLRLIENDIVSTSTIDELGNVRQSYTQVNGNYAINGTSWYSFRFKPWDIEVGNSVNFGHNRSSQIVNNVINPSTRWNIRYWLNLSKTVDSLLESGMTLGANYSKSNVANSSYNNNEQIQYEFNTNHTLTLPLKIKVIGEFNAVIMPVSNSYTQNQSYYLLSAGLERSFLKENVLTARLYFYDILGQNRSVFRYIGSNQINETINQALTRYVMLSLMYKFKNKSKSNSNESGL